MEFRVLSREEAESAGLGAPPQVVYGVALDSLGEVVSIASIDTSRRGLRCDNCTKNCATGGVVWTRSDYRQQDVFGSLFYWLKGELGIDKVYIHNPSPAGRLIAARFGLSIPKDIDGFPPIENLRESELAVGAAATALKEIL